MSSPFVDREALADSLAVYPWIPPIIREEIGKLPWEDASRDAISRYLKITEDVLDRLVRRLSDGSAEMASVIERFAQPGVLDKELARYPAETFAESGLLLLQADLNVTYERVVLNCAFSAYWQAMGSLSTGHIADLEARIGTVADLSVILHSLGDWREALLLALDVLGFSRDDGLPSPEAMLWRLKETMADERTFPACLFLKEFAKSLTLGGYHLHARAALMFRLRIETPFPSPEQFRQIVTQQVDRLLRLESFRDSDPFHEFIVHSLVRNHVEIVGALRENEIFLSRIAADDEFPLLGSHFIVDCMIGASGGQIPWASLDFLSSRNLNYGLALTLVWVETLFERGEAEAMQRQVIEQFQSTLRMWEGDFWHAGEPRGILLLLAGFVTGSMLQVEVDIHANQKLLQQLSVDDWTFIGTMFANANSPHDVQISRFSAAMLARTLLVDGFSKEALELLVAAYDFENLKGADLRERCRMVLHNCGAQSISSNAEAVGFGLLLFLLANECYIDRAEELAHAFFGSEDDYEWTPQRLVRLRELAPDVLPILLGGLIRTASLGKIHYQVRQVAQWSLQLPDFVESSDEELRDAICPRISAEQEPLARIVVFDSLVGIAECVGNEYGGAYAMRVLEIMLEFWGVPVVEVCDRIRNCSVEEFITIRIGVIMMSNFVTQQNSERFLALSQAMLERQFGPNTGWPMLIELVDDPPSPAYMDWVWRNGVIAFIAVYLRSLRENGLRDFATRQLEECDEKHVSTVFGYSTYSHPISMTLAIEISYLLTPLEYSTAYRIHTSIIQCLREHFTYFQADAHVDYDRLLAAQHSTKIRTGLVALGNGFVRHDPDNHDLRIWNLLVESEFSQRTLVTRQRFGSMIAEIPNAADLPRLTPRAAVRDLGFAHREQSRRRMSERVIPMEQPQTRLNRVKQPRTEWEPYATKQATTEEISLLNPVASPEGIARWLKPDEMLLRMGFDMEGHLVWTLFRLVEKKVVVAACDQGECDDAISDAISAILSDFDCVVNTIWDCYELLRRSPNLDARHAGDVKSLQFDQDKLATDHWESVLARIVRRLANLPRLRDAAIAEFGQIESWDTAIRQPNWKAWWDDKLVLYERYNAYFAGRVALRETPSRVETVLNDATELFLGEISSLLPVADIVSALDRDLHLVIWGDDILLGVPLSFLTVRHDDGSTAFLFEYSQSVRTIVSPLLDEWMYEKDMGRPPRRRPIAATAAWLDSPFGDPDDGLNADEINDADRLAEMFDDIFIDVLEPREYFEWRTLSHREVTHDAIARTLSEIGERPVALLAICGHGHDQPQGMIMGDGVWDGSTVWKRISESPPVWKRRAACQLAEVDLILQLSCSIGRLRQTGVQDVNGFCVELFCNRARSVVAGRWPLHGAESVQLAGWIAEHYFDGYPRSAIDEAIWLGTRPRASAIAAVRRRWAEQHRAVRADDVDLPVGINTMANLDLYGLG
ncbi:hypothetical protein LOC68_01680 [Blastopirellula sp. JC732]|uniref:CHAT domain-containing protein n=1 Tax=Blastopirellula sediminis TaxID=2894196 RepID=A0A9X1MJ27_9BACT|nr:hypothetical protein [Blastopirellula sediminis]MCC9608102.1 hypothetical protein [Blastopirellula sediminis]MCC9627105.1 hypothetical protein [Blastopirellula sediminis]